MKIGIISFTPNGERLNEKLVASFQSKEVYGYHKSKQSKGNLLRVNSSLTEWTQEAFKSYEAIVFIGATGIAVRAIAPFIKSKEIDPAVIVLDEKGDYVISLLSGHIGGANKLTQEIAQLVNGIPIISTATDKNNLFAVDEWAHSEGLCIKEIHRIKEISSALLRGEQVGLITKIPLAGKWPEGIKADEGMQVGIVIDSDSTYEPFNETLHLIPSVMTLGIGCRRGISLEAIERLVIPKLEALKIDIEAIEKITSIDLKQDEPGLLAFCEKYNKPFLTYSSEALQKARGEFTPSAFVKQVTQVDNVCERAAILGSNHGELILRKTAKEGVTMAIARAEKQYSF